MTQIARDSDIATIGLSDSDLEERTGIVVGWTAGEMLPPYRKKYSPHLSRAERQLRNEQAKPIRAYVKARRFHTCAFVFESNAFFRRYKPSQVVEVAGGITSLCVAGAAEDIIKKGHHALINLAHVISPHPRMPKYWVGKLLLRDLLSQQYDTKCLIRGDEFIFYRNDICNP